MFKLTGFQMIKGFITGKYAKRFDTFLETSDDENFVRNFIKILEFVKPKMQRIDYAVQNHDDNTINIIHSYPSEKK